MPALPESRPRLSQAALKRISAVCQRACKNAAPVHGFIAQFTCWSSFPLPQTDLAYWLSDRYAKSCVAVENGDTDLNFRDLPFEVPRHQRLAE